jgi:hypothetical protein
MRVFAAIWVIGLPFLGCGGSSLSSSLGSGDDGGGSGGSGADASTEGGSGGGDSGGGDSGGSEDADGGCVNPVVGQSCTASDTVCPDGISPCCRSYVWTCDSSSHRWTQSPNLLGCACTVGVTCGGTNCAQGQVCVVEHVSGGPCLLPEDGGLCPDGTKPAGACCNNTSTSYTCAARPTGCGSTLTCGCAASLCTLGTCQGADGGELQCNLFAP